MELPRAVLDSVPNLAGRRRSALGTNQVVDTGLELGERVLHVAALGEAGTQENGVGSQQDPRAALEENGAEQEADPEKDLETGDNGHGGIIVLLDKVADRVRERVLGVLHLGAGRGTGRRRELLRRHDRRDQVCAGVGSDVKHGVDAVGEHREGVLRHHEPHNRHHCCETSQHKMSTNLRIWICASNVLRY